MPKGWNCLAPPIGLDAFRTFKGNIALENIRLISQLFIIIDNLQTL